MSDLLNNNEQEESTTTYTNENTSKLEVNSWRKRHSFIGPDNPIISRRRMSQGELVWITNNYQFLLEILLIEIY